MTGMPEKRGKYQILDIAGSGNMGVVYVGYDPFVDRKVAIKVCSVNDEEDADTRLTRKMFFNEAHTAGALDHPNILRIYDAGEEDNEAYIVMEYIEGAKTLKDYCDVDNLLPVKSIVEIIYRCAKALDYAHRRGVIHRDIKPTNIMIAEDGNVKIGDFGIAQRIASDDTHVMGMVGSPRYMSPEQAQEQPVTQRTDIYSLGVVAFELLTGQPPFSAPGFSRLIYKVLHEDPADIRKLRADIPDRLNAIVQRAMQKDPAGRYASGSELAGEMAAVFSNLESLASPLSEDEKFNVVRGLKFFNEFSDQEVREVIGATAWETYGSGEKIITEGNMEHSFYVIAVGDVCVAKSGRRISKLTKGDCFGEMGYLSKIKRTASIVADDEVTILKVNSTLMDQASLTCQLRFNQVFLKTLIERLARTSEDLSRHVGSDQAPTCAG